MQNLNDLNRLFGREDNIQFIEGPSGMPLIQVATSRASAKVALYGGQMSKKQKKKEKRKKKNYNLKNKVT